jgi:DNA-binding SARP family transcriptional activator
VEHRSSDYALLGPLEVRSADGPLALGGAKQRAVLALLLVNANRVLSLDRLVDGLWSDPPQRAVKTIQVYVSQLRKVLPDAVILTRSPGYVLEIESDALDVSRFEQLVARARRSQPQLASRLLGEALGLWRGPPLAEFADEPFARAEADRLGELRLSAIEERIEADLALSRQAELVAELEALVAEQPHRERFRAQLMLSLYRSGRQTEALQVYRAARAALDELGLEPSPALRQLEQQILRQDPSLDSTGGPLLSATGRGVPLPGPLVPSSPFPFVGRAHELETLRALLDRAEEGEGGLVLLAGEAGAGKTRLVRELAHEAADRGALVCYGASDAAVTVLYQPIRDWFEFLVGACDHDDLRDCLGHAGAIARLVPELAPLAARRPMDEAELDADRYVLASAVSGFFSKAARRQTLLLVADDMQWADGETPLLLQRLARAAPAARILVILAFRHRGEEIHGEVESVLAELTRLDGVTRITLPNLRPEEVAEFVRASADTEPTPELASALGELTSGSPFLVCALWRDLVESGAIEISSDQATLDRPLDELRGAERIGDLVRQRLAGIDPETASTIELAAVAGSGLELRVLRPAARLTLVELAATLERAVARGILEEVPDREPAWRFTHELVRREVYDRISIVRRAELHLRIGEALEHVHSADPVRALPDLAHHFTLAAPVAGPERGVAYNLRAADEALGTGAFGETADRLSSAVMLGIARPRERARVLVELGYVFRQLQRRLEAVAAFEEGLELATVLGERGIRARAVAQLVACRLADVGGDPAAEAAICEDAIAILEEEGDDYGLAASRNVLGILFGRLGRTEEATAQLELALVHATVCHDQNARRSVKQTLCHNLCLDATPVVEAIDRCEELLAAARPDEMLEAMVKRPLALLYAMAERPAEAFELLEQSSPLLPPVVAQPQMAAVFLDHVALARELAGDREGAVLELEQMRSWHLENGRHRMAAVRAATELVRLHYDAGRWDEAEEMAAFVRSEPLAEDSRGSATRRVALEARLAAHRGRLDDAFELAERAVDRAESRESDLNLRASMWATLGEVRRQGGERAGADDAIATALSLYERKGNRAAATQLRAVREVSRAPAPG